MDEERVVRSSSSSGHNGDTRPRTTAVRLSSNGRFKVASSSSPKSQVSGYRTKTVSPDR